MVENRTRKHPWQWAKLACLYSVLPEALNGEHLSSLGSQQTGSLISDRATPPTVPSLKTHMKSVPTSRSWVISNSVAQSPATSTSRTPITAAVRLRVQNAPTFSGNQMAMNRSTCTQPEHRSGHSHGKVQTQSGHRHVK